MVVLEARNLGRIDPAGNGIRPLLRDVSFRLGSGQVLAVVGRSGAGKTTLLRLLNRLDEATHGEVLVHGRDYREFAPTELRRRIGMIMQRPYLFPGSVAMNVRYGPENAVDRYLRASFHASLIPAVDNLRSLGIVWIPAIMTGMLLSASSPMYAALYQFVVLGMIVTAGGLSCLTATYLAPKLVFTPHQQLLRLTLD